MTAAAVDIKKIKPIVLSLNDRLITHWVNRKQKLGRQAKIISHERTITFRKEPESLDEIKKHDKYALRVGCHCKHCQS